MKVRYSVSRCCCGTMIPPVVPYARMYSARWVWSSTQDPVLLERGQRTPGPAPLVVDDFAFVHNTEDDSNQGYHSGPAWVIHFDKAISSVTSLAMTNIGGSAIGQSLPDYDEPDQSLTLYSSVAIYTEAAFQGAEPYSVDRSTLSIPSVVWDIPQLPNRFTDAPLRLETPDLASIVNPVLAQPSFDGTTHVVVILGEVTTPPDGEYPNLNGQWASSYFWGFWEDRSQFPAIQYPMQMVYTE